MSNFDNDNASVRISECKLVEGLLNDENEAFESLVRQYSGAMFSVIVAIVNNTHDAQDCLQKAFVQVFENIHSFRQDASLKTWLHRIALNTALMWLRSQKRHQTVDIDEFSQQYNHYGERTVFADNAGLNIEQWFERNETKSSLHQLICQLPEKYCNVLLLRDIQGLSTKETSVYLDISESLVKTQLHRARLFLKAAFEQLQNSKKPHDGKVQ